MRLITSIDDMQQAASDLRARGLTIALVPTMGALHEGHLSLVRRACREAGAAVVSIFVNPAQFSPTEDFSRYPRQLDRDLEKLAPLGVEAVFAPDAAAMYPPGFSTWVEPGALAARLEGAARPGHFRGVLTVVLKLLTIVRPGLAVFGQKDFQQAVLVRRLIQDFNLGALLVVSPIVREPDGLALSSRNAYRSPDDRRAALALYRSLERARSLAAAGEADARRIAGEMRSILDQEPRVATDYAALVDPANLDPVERVTPGTVALVAARAGGVRLIDNLILGPAGATDEERIARVFGASRQGMASAKPLGGRTG